MPSTLNNKTNDVKSLVRFLKKSVAEENYDNHPKDSFTKESLLKFWNEYQEKIYKKGQQNLGSVLNSCQPEISENFVLIIKVPSKLMADTLHKGTPKLLKFLRESLNNYSISIEPSIDKSIAKKFAYTPQEKFDKLKEINPALQKLKDVFKLDL